ncbi:hypothetical protein [Priestia megaterium]|uniref:hypothetical protein n=1 Tax=Priestia megaterium TaxID=1404 RepID=UPI00189EB7CB|nr:hypothetical protein [Priestia megaterium]
MNINLDPNLIDEFRDKVNEKAIFYQHFMNIQNKNKWNLICSAMDWITITVEGLPLINLKRNTIGAGYNALQSLNLMQYVIAVDILVQSIVQLHRALYNTNTYPLDKDRGIFKQDEISDDIYFKHIRAIFGAHPVSLNSLNGKPTKQGERFFASWITEDLIDGNDFSVFIYSNNPDDNKDHSFGISIKDINLYVEKRYNLLHNLMDRVDLILSNHKEEYRKKLIMTNSNKFEQLKILHKENIKRLGENEGYASLISYIYRLLSVKINEDPSINTSFIEEYRNHLTSFIDTIKRNLQDMKYEHIPLQKEVRGYQFEKIISYIRTGKHPVGEVYFNNLIKIGILPSYLLNCENRIEKELIFDAILHKAYKRNSRAIEYKELMEIFLIK